MKANFWNKHFRVLENCQTTSKLEIVLIITVMLVGFLLQARTMYLLVVFFFFKAFTDFRRKKLHVVVIATEASHVKVYKTANPAKSSHIRESLRQLLNWFKKEK